MQPSSLPDPSQFPPWPSLRDFDSHNMALSLSSTTGPMLQGRRAPLLAALPSKSRAHARLCQPVRCAAPAVPFLGSDVSLGRDLGREGNARVPAAGVPRCRCVTGFVAEETLGFPAAIC